MTAEDRDELRTARQAAMWLIRLQSEGRACHAACTAWLLESSGHVKAFLLAAAMSKRIKALDLGAIDVDELIRQAQDRVVPLTSGRGSAGQPAASEHKILDRRLPGKGTHWKVGAAGILFAIIVSIVAASITHGAETYATEVGQQMRIPLEDGSVISLNTNSLVKIRYSATMRDIKLLKGEALFTVEPDIRRPFRVSAGTAVVLAVGTTFDVYRQSARTLIEVVKGKVNVSPDGAAGRWKAQSSSDRQTGAAGVPFTAGERVSIDREGQISRDARNIQLAQDWQQRQLVFDDAPFAEAAAEFNRYNRARIVVEDEELRARPVSGTFSADHPQALILFLQKTEKRVAVDRDGDDFVIRLRPPEAP